ncbi:hypothetical protein Micbo1qcDRAFT_160276, partial [Microdochium bolleyi]
MACSVLQVCLVEWVAVGGRLEGRSRLLKRGKVDTPRHPMARLAPKQLEVSGQARPRRYVKHCPLRSERGCAGLTTTDRRQGHET